MLAEAWSLGTLGWFDLLPTIFASLALIGIAAAVVYALRQANVRKRSLDGGEAQVQEQQVLSAREILQIRYVCGEITREQYYEMLEDLN